MSWECNLFLTAQHKHLFASLLIVLIVKKIWFHEPFTAIMVLFRYFTSYTQSAPCVYFQMFSSSILLPSSCLNIRQVAKCACYSQIRAKGGWSYKLHSSCNSCAGYLIIKQNKMLSLSNRPLKWHWFSSDACNCHARFFSNVAQSLRQKQKPAEKKEIIEAKEKPFAELSTSQKGQSDFVSDYKKFNLLSICMALPVMAYHNSWFVPYSIAVSYLLW